MTSLLFSPALPPSHWLIDLSWVSGGKYKSSHCHFKQRDNQTRLPTDNSGEPALALTVCSPLSLSLSCFLLILFMKVPLSLYFLLSSEAHLLSSSSSTPSPPLLRDSVVHCCLLLAAPVSCICSSSLVSVPWGAGGNSCLSVCTKASALHMTVLCLSTRREINTFGLVALPSV